MIFFIDFFLFSVYVDFFSLHAHFSSPAFPYGFVSLILCYFYDSVLFARYAGMDVILRSISILLGCIVFIYSRVTINSTEKERSLFSYSLREVGRFPIRYNIKTKTHLQKVCKQPIHLNKITKKIKTHGTWRNEDDKREIQRVQVK